MKWGILWWDMSPMMDFGVVARENENVEGVTDAVSEIILIVGRLTATSGNKKSEC